MLRRTPLRLAAGSLTMVVAGFAAAPALAAGQTATGTAAALVATIANMPTDSGRYTAENDGTTETSSGTQNPAGLPAGQNVLNVGLLVQDAATSVKDGDLGSVACAGLAGPDAAIVPVGESGADCVGTDKTLNLTGSGLDLGKAIVGAGGIKSELPTELQTALGSFDLSTLTDALNKGIQTFGMGTGVSFNLNAIEGKCSALPGNLTGSAKFANVSLTATPPGMDPVTLFKLDSDPGVNEDISVTAAGLADDLIKSLTASLTSGAATTGPLAPVLKGLPTGLSQTDVITAAAKAGAAQLATAVAPLLTGTANEQTSDDNSIHVTAFDGKLLPAAAAATGGSALASLKIGDVTCSTGTVAAVDTPTASPTPTVAPTVAPVVPTSVDSGLSGDQGSSPFLPIVGGLMLLAGAGIGVRRFLSTRG